MRTGMSGSTVSSLVADPHQTATISIANTTKAVTQRRTDPYGNARGTATGTWPGDRGFLNKVQDSSGLTQVGARYYDAKIGRFISVDPVFDMASPQQWGAYSYADNNPVSFSDDGSAVPREDVELGQEEGQLRVEVDDAVREEVPGGDRRRCHGCRSDGWVPLRHRRCGKRRLCGPRWRGSGRCDEPLEIEGPEDPSLLVGVART